MLDALIADIRAGKWRKQVEQIQAAGSQEERSKFKPYLLPAFTPTGVQPTKESHADWCAAESGSFYCDKGDMRRDTKTPFESRTGLVALDIDLYKDGDNESATDVRDKLAASKHCAAAFISTSGAGVKALLRVEPTPQSQAQHLQAWKSCVAWMQAELGIEANTKTTDPPGNNIIHLQFVSYDPSAYLNIEAEPLDWETGAQSSRPRAGYRTDTQGPGRREFDETDIREMLSYCDVDGSRNDYRFKIARAIRAWDNDGERGKALWLEFAKKATRSPYPNSEYERSYDATEGTGPRITVGTLVKFAVEGGYRPDDATRRNSEFTSKPATSATSAGISHPNPLMRGYAGEATSRADVADVAGPTHFDREPTPLGSAWRLLNQRANDLLLRQSSEAELIDVMVDSDNGVWRQSDDVVHHAVLDATAPWLLDQGPPVPKEKFKYWQVLQTPAGVSSSIKMCGIAYEAMLEARCVPDGLTVAQSTLMDTRHYLGAANGVVDLTTGGLLTGAEARTKLVSMMLPDAYDPDAQHDLVD